MHFFYLVCCIAKDCSWELTFDQKQKSCVKHIHLVTDGGSVDQRTIWKAKKIVHLCFMVNLSTKYGLFLHIFNQFVFYWRI